MTFPKLAVTLLVGLVPLMTSSCSHGGASARAVPGSMAPFASLATENRGRIEIQVHNEWTTVARVSLVLPGGGEIRLGRVEARTSRTFSIPEIWASGTTRLIAHPNAVWNGPGFYRSEPLVSPAGSVSSWTLVDRPGVSAYAEADAPIRILDCRGC